MSNDKKTINEVAKITGTTVRTLHYYDEIGLLNPSEILDNGYRVYDDGCLKRLQQILFFKELGFELKEINQILEDDTYNEKEALKNHRNLLMMKVKRLKSLINLVDKNLKGENDMSFKEFDMSEIEKAQKEYADEVNERWGNTNAFTQSVNKTKKYTQVEWKKIMSEGDAIFAEFTKIMGEGKAYSKAFDLVRKWQEHITQYFYDCSDEMLLGLADMYAIDERFKKNIDKYGEGTANFISEAIKSYCKN